MVENDVAYLVNTYLVFLSYIYIYIYLYLYLYPLFLWYTYLFSPSLLTFFYYLTISLLLYHTLLSFYLPPLVVSKGGQVQKQVGWLEARRSQ